MKTLRLAALLLSATLFCACSDSGSDDDDTNKDKIVQDDENTTATIDDSYVYTLPVIFHVLYSDASDDTQYVKYDRIVSLLNTLNDLYAGGIYGESENIGVKFVLATYDEDGNKLERPGVEYVKYNGTYPIDHNDFMTDNDKKYTKYIWNPNDYINIMLYNFAEESSSSVTLGISHLPYVVESDSALVGLEKVSREHLSKSNLAYAYCVSINSSYIYYESSRYTTDKGNDTYMYSSYDANVTLAHEVGHYLGLHHAFTERDTDGGYAVVDSCGDTDYCDDTPTYNRYEYSKQLKEYMTQHVADSNVNTQLYFLRYDCENGQFYSENLMDYECCYSFRFTPQQRKRIRTVLYYSPLMPGPKRGADGKAATRSTTRGDSEGTLNLPIRTSVCN